MAQKPDTIETLVTFAAAEKPYHGKYEPTVTIARVLQEALGAFGVHGDGTTRYYLMLSGTELNGSETVGDLAMNPAGHTRALKLGLRTETISGSR